MILIVVLVHVWLLWIVGRALVVHYRPAPPELEAPRIAWNHLHNDDLEWVHKHMRLFD